METLIFLLGIQLVTGTYLGERFGVLSSPELFTRSIQFYLSKEAALTQECRAQLIDFVSSLDDNRQWALEMYDANGKLPSGILDGNFVEMGSFDECINVGEGHKGNTSLSGKYCLGMLAIPSEYIKKIEGLPPELDVPPYMNFSVCFPNSCTAADLEKVTDGIGLNLTLDEKMCQTKATQAEITTGGYITLVLSVIILIVMIASTVYEIIHKGNSNEVLKSFSVWTNGKKIFSIAKPDHNQIPCFYGLRVLSLISVIVAHTTREKFRKPIRNSYEYFYFNHHFKNIPLAYADVSVEVFFLIGGFLTSYSFLQKTEKGHKFNIILHYVERYLRLTPPAAVVLIFTLTWLNYFGSGPLWPTIDQFIQPCQISWWSYLLYIQNYLPHLCIVPTWYLSLDFQLFLLSPLLLIPLKNWPKQVLALALSLALFCVVSTFMLAWILEIPASMTRSGTAVPWYMRFYLLIMGPSWFFGFALGCFIFKVKKGEGIMVIEKHLTALSLVFALMLIVLSIFGVYHVSIAQYNRLENSLCLALLRFVGAIAVSYIIYLCEIGRGGVINKFLSHPFFEVMSRLSYSMFLTHIFGIEYNINSVRVAPFVNNFNLMINDVPGNVLLAFLSALLLSLSIELPVQNLVTVLMKRIRRKNQ